MKIFFLLFSCSFVLQAHAKLGVLVKDFVGQNFELKIDKLKVEQAQLGYEQLLLTKNFTLTLSGNYDDNKLDTSSTMNLSSAKNTSFVLGVSKSFFTGTTISLNSTLLNNDRSAVNSAWLGTSPTVVNQFSQEFSITQELGKNFLGYSEKLLRDIKKENVSLSNLEHLEYQDSQLAQFYKAYLNLVKSKLSEQLQLLAYKRAQQRTRLVKKKWKDGLASKAELLQAHNAQMVQKEQLDSIKIATRGFQAELESKLNHGVSDKNLNLPTLGEYKTSVLPKGELENSVTYLKLQKLLQIGELGVAAQKKSLLPSIQLVAAYKSNDYDADRSVTLQQGYLGKGEHELKVGVNITAQWGMENEYNLLAQKKIVKQRSEYSLQKFKVSFKAQKQKLLYECRLLRENLKLAQQREVIAKEALKEYTRLYRVGKSDLDQLIRAEESLIATQKSELDHYISYEMRTIDLSQLYGNILTYLANRKLTTEVSIEKYH